MALRRPDVVRRLPALVQPRPEIGAVAGVVHEELLHAAGIGDDALATAVRRVRWRRDADPHVLLVVARAHELTRRADGRHEREMRLAP